MALSPCPTARELLRPFYCDLKQGLYFCVVPVSDKMYEWKVIGWQSHEDIIAQAERRERLAAAHHLLCVISICPRADGQRFLKHLLEYPETEPVASLALKDADAPLSSLHELMKQNRALREELLQSKRDKADMGRQIMALRLDRAITAGKVCWKLLFASVEPNMYYESTVEMDEKIVIAASSTGNIYVLDTREIGRGVPKKRCTPSENSEICCVFLCQERCLGLVKNIKSGLAALYLIDPLKDQWTHVTQLPRHHQLQAVSVTSWKTKIIVSGGVSAEGWTPSTLVDIYDIMTHEWSRLPSMLAGRWAFTSVVVKSQLIVGGGMTSSHLRSNTVEALSLDNPEEWKSLPSTACYGCTLVAPCDNVLATGGWASPDKGCKTVCNTVERLDENAVKWSRTSSMKQSRGSHGACATKDGSVVVVGGANDESFLGSLEVLSVLK